MKAFLSILLLLSSNYTFCQAPETEWQKSYGGTGEDNANWIQQTNDGGYIIAGTTQSADGDVTTNKGLADVWVIKTDAAGAIQWQKSFGGSNYDEAFSVQQTSDGGYIVAGDTYSNNGDVTGNHGVYDYWVVKLDASGSIEWQKTFGGSSFENAYAIQQTTDGGYIVAGAATSNDGDVTGHHGSSTSSFDYWIVKLDASGNIQWQKVYGGSNNDFANAIQQTSDGGYIIAGASNSNDIDVTGNHGNYDYWIVKLDDEGSIEWQKSFGGSDEDRASSVRQTIDGGYVVAGFSRSNNGDVTGHHGSVGYPDYWILKLDDHGNMQWKKSLGYSSSDYGTCIVQTPDKGYVLTGRAYFAGSVYGFYGDFDYCVIKLDEAGNTTWQKLLGGSLADYSTCIGLTNDGGYIVGGYSYSGGIGSDHHGNNSTADYWIVKFGTDGTLPIQLVSFNGYVQSSVAQVSWRSGVEENFEQFELEKSTDAKNFTTIATIAAKGSNSSYIFSTPQKEALAYYRLKMVDNDGRLSYSSIVALRQDADAISLHPNPASEFINVKVTAGCDAAICNTAGRLIQRVRLKNGENNIQISRLDKGVYFLVTEKNKLQFIKQ